MPSEDRERTEYYYTCSECENSEVYLASLTARARVALRRSDLGFPELFESPAGLVYNDCEPVPQNALCPNCNMESLTLARVATIC